MLLRTGVIFLSKVDDIYRVHLIGACCRDHRKTVLHLTLEQFQEQTGIKLKTISNFENGRSGNVYYMFYYINLTNNSDDKIKLMNKLLRVAKEVFK